MRLVQQKRVLRVLNGYLIKLEVIIIKFKDFVATINKSQYRKKDLNRETFIEEMLSSVYPSYKGAYKPETLLSFYKGNKPIYPSVQKQTGNFSIEKAKCFLVIF